MRCRGRRNTIRDKRGWLAKQVTNTPRSFLRMPDVCVRFPSGPPADPLLLPLCRVVGSKHDSSPGLHGGGTRFEGGTVVPGRLPPPAPLKPLSASLPLLSLELSLALPLVAATPEGFQLLGSTALASSWPGRGTAAGRVLYLTGGIAQGGAGRGLVTSHSVPPSLPQPACVRGGAYLLGGWL